MKRMIVLSILAICPATHAGEKPGVAIGIFDSRAVAMAWARGGTFQKKFVAMKAERDAAKAKGDDKRVAELEKEGPALQDRLHRQVFGNEPIDAVLKVIEKDLQGIARAAGVDIQVSKWEIAYQSPDAKMIDVTWELVNLFKPDEETRKLIKELLKTQPLPADELKHDH